MLSPWNEFLLYAHHASDVPPLLNCPENQPNDLGNWAKTGESSIEGWDECAEDFYAVNGSLLTQGAFESQGNVTLPFFEANIWWENGPNSYFIK